LNFKKSLVGSGAITSTRLPTFKLNEMAKEKKILLTIPAELNKKLNLHLIDIRDLNVETTKAKLCIKLIEIGLKNESKEA